MKHLKAFLKKGVFLALLLLFAWADGMKSPAKTSVDDGQEISKLSLEESFCTYLSSDLWQLQHAADSNLVLLLPLEYSFLTNHQPLKTCFSNYVNRLVTQQKHKPENVDTLSWLEHLHWVSRYIVLSQEDQYTDWLYGQFMQYWRQEPAWLWEHEDFQGIRERLQWKLDTPRETLNRSYYNAIFDEDYFAVSLGVDLYGIFRRQGKICEDCEQAKAMFERIFTERVQWFDDGRWLIDVGAWKDHPDWAYSAYLKEPKNAQGEMLPSKSDPMITVDSSHAIRYPSWLRSAQLAFEDTEFVVLLKKGLAKQLLEKVIVSSATYPVPILNNYMNGHNGYYRYGYGTHQGYFQGYGPYALSSTFAYGIWSLLGKDLAPAYEQLAKAYPLSEEVLQLYSESSTREVHPLLKNAWKNGLLEHIAKMSVEVSYGLEEGNKGEAK